MFFDEVDEKDEIGIFFDELMLLAVKLAISARCQMNGLIGEVSWKLNKFSS